ncbi:membrane protein insertase YidC [Owenweeksia hongkongensis]|uniref:membrane protein insertase YidC n=1 Tax=Owenweeksia hongkongensis TaxID=253245 RepID=UPI003A9305A7
MENKGMDRNTIIGMLLIGGIFLFFYFFNKPNAELEQTPNKVDSTEIVEETKQLEEVNNNQLDSVVVDSNQLFAPATAASEELFTLENKFLEVVISSNGGQIVQARLKKYQTYDSLPLYLINKNADFNIAINGDRPMNTADLVFAGVQNSDNKVTMTLDAGSGKSLTYVYTIEPDNYMLGWDVVSSGMGNMLPQDGGLQWEMKTLRQEKNIETENTVTELEYRFANEDDMDNLSGSGDDSEEVQNIKWLAYKQQFFSSILINKNADFEKAGLASKTIEGSEEFTKLLVSKVSLNSTAGDVNSSFGLYLGPNKYEVLESYEQGFEELIPLGWGILGWINRGIVINLFNWLEGYGLNYGLIILAIALLIKIILFPFTYASYRSMAKMRVLKPEIDELNEKYKDKDPMKKQQATMELYRKAGVNPLGGCIPMLFQMPILIALFRFFPASIELRQQPFLWAHDLSTYDSIYDLPFNIPFYGDHVSLFTLLMTVSTLIYTYMNQQLTGSNNQMPQLKYMMYLMPVVFLGVFNNYAAGLSYYYFVANVITFGQQFAIRAFLDDDKIHAKIQEKKAQPKKENRFMRRMREVQEEQNRQARRKK